MSENELENFFNSQSEEEQKALQESIDSASSEGKIKGVKLKASGSFLMEVPTYAFKDKKTGEMITKPGYKRSETKGVMSLSLPLVVSDGCEGAPKGASLITNIVISPAPGANKETRDKFMSMMKPKIVALTGEESISMTAKWFDEWIFPEYEEKDGKFNLIKDHKMKNKVMVITELVEWEKEIVPSVKAIIKAKDGNHSVVEEVAKEIVTNQNMKTPSESEFSKEPEMSDDKIEGAVDDGDTVEVDIEKEVNSLPDDF